MKSELKIINNATNNAIALSAKICKNGDKL